MARRNSGSTSNYLSKAITVSAYPFSMGGWFCADVTNQFGVVCSLGYAGTDGRFAAIQLFNTGLCHLHINANGVFNATAAGPYVARQWNHVLAVINQTTQKLYQNGREVISGTTDLVSWGGWDMQYLNIRRISGGFGIPIYGSISHVAYWNAALTQGDALELSRGAHPSQIRPFNLVSGTDLSSSSGGERDYARKQIATPWALTGTMEISQQPSIIMPNLRRVLVRPPGRIMGSLAGYGGLAGPGGLAGRHGGLSS